MSCSSSLSESEKKIRWFCDLGDNQIWTCRYINKNFRSQTMDNFGWDDPTASTIMGASSYLWSNHQQGIFGPIPELQRITTSDNGPAMNSINEALMAQYMVNQNLSPNGLITDFSVVDQDVNLSEDNNKAGLLSGGTVSLESLDCLLSATSSINTDTSVEDDGISMIFSDCRTLWNFGSSSAVSSGESENVGSSHRNNREMVSQAQMPTTSTTARPSSTNKRSKVNLNYHYFDLLQSDSSTTEGGFQLISENPPRSKKLRLENHHQGSSNINFQYQSSSSLSSSVEEPDTEAIAHMKEMMYRAAAFRPVDLGMKVVEKPKRKNVRISSDPQTVAARHRRERISEKIGVLQRLVPGGNKMDTATMLDEAANYLKFLRSQVKALENLGNKLDFVNYNSTNLPFPSTSFNFRHPFPMQTFFPLPKP
ncbi:hypothetical protein NE237_028143 [Protea cynaroides]|uniref:BHLH domain-containing protein n=1 Tax=Protea cynaroides TaxID=273540 RepID=A0A9Q0GQL8_9MAGN|nr:hypothetical protein NE237_028143 [Protea cynaroides]